MWGLEIKKWLLTHHKMMERTKTDCHKAWS